jgi:hypothetical protein
MLGIYFDVSMHGDEMEDTEGEKYVEAVNV